VQADGTAVPSRSLAQRAVSAAVELHLIEPTEVDSGSVQVQSLNHSSSVGRLICGDRAWIVKNAGGTPRPGNDWRAELAVYRSAPLDSDRSAVPDLLGYSQHEEVVLIESLDRNWRRLDSFELRSPWSIEIVSRVATGLAHWHQASQSLCDIAGAEVPFFAESDAFLGQSPGSQRLHEAIRDVENAWVTSHVMHGDVCLTNVMCHDDGPIRLIDWTTSGWGDPRWDLAGLLQELHSAEIERGIDTTAHRVAVLASYAERGPSPSVLAETDPTLQAFLAARLIRRAIQIQRSPKGTSDSVAAHLAAARAVRSG